MQDSTPGQQRRREDSSPRNHVESERFRSTTSPNRRQLLGAIAAGTAGGLAGCSVLPSPFADEGENGSDGSTPSPEPTPENGDGLPLELEPVVRGLGEPLAAAFPPDLPEHVYVAEREGFVRVVGPDGLRGDPLLDLEGRVVGGGERGLLGMALSPDFERTRRLYLRYSAEPGEDTPDDHSHTSVLAEFEVYQDGLYADIESERTIMEVSQPHANHNAGDLAFGPDGFLYVPLGDGGSSGDHGPGHSEDWYDGNPGGNGQNVSANLHGGIHRIDVEGREEHVYGEYGIPRDNPLVGRDGYDEYYAWGFRNPWRISFDGGGLFVADVGEDRLETINVVERGGNYGWNVREGSECFDAATPMEPREDCPEHTPEGVRDGEPLLDPVVEYPNSKIADEPVSGSAVVCGYIYEGRAVPALAGRFLFGDWQAGGQLFAASPSAEGGWSAEPVEVADPELLHLIYGFERDPTGTIYILAFDDDANGVVHRVPV